MEFSFEVRHIPGVSNPLPDALSRLYPVPQRSEDSGTVNLHCANMSLLPEEYTLLLEPEDAAQRLEILQVAHALGHQGAKSVANRVRESGFSWADLPKDAHDLVAACPTCQRYSISRRGFHPMRSVTANVPMAHVAVDLAESTGIHPGLIIN